MLYFLVCFRYIFVSAQEVKDGLGIGCRQQQQHDSWQYRCQETEIFVWRYSVLQVRSFSRVLKLHCHVGCNIVMRSYSWSLRGGIQHIWSGVFFLMLHIFNADFLGIVWTFIFFFHCFFFSFFSFPFLSLFSWVTCLWLAGDVWC